MVKIKEIKISIHRKYTKDFQSYGYRIGVMLDVDKNDPRGDYYQGKAFLNDRIAEEDLIIKNIMDKKDVEKKSGYKELNFVPEGNLIVKDFVNKGVVKKKLVEIPKVKSDMIYRHKCDKCGGIFRDDKNDMEHYANNNGLMLCVGCRIGKSAVENIGDGGDGGNVMIPFDVKQIKRTSARAVLVELFGVRGDLWIPKSCIGDGDAMDLMEKGVKTMLFVKNWFLEKEGLI